MQVQGSPGHPMMYRGALDAFARISREEGLGAFYKGEQRSVAREHEPKCKADNVVGAVHATLPASKYTVERTQQGDIRQVAVCGSCRLDGHLLFKRTGCH